MAARDNAGFVVGGRKISAMYEKCQHFVNFEHK
jgi:hypothetical protein